MPVSIAWNIDADGDWTAAENWRPARLPDASDIVRIDTADFHTITYEIDTSTVASLRVLNDAFAMSQSVLTLTNASSFDNALSLSGATLILNSTTVVLGQFSADSTSTIGGTGALFLSGGTLNGTMTGSGTTLLKGDTTLNGLIVENGRLLENQGDLTFSGGPNSSETVTLGLDPAGAGTVLNNAGATMDFASKTIFQASSSGASFVNKGLIENSAFFSEIDTPFVNTNTGHISINSGSLGFGSSSLSAVSGVSISSGASLIVKSSGATPFTFTGHGTLGSAGSTLTDNGTISFGGATVVDARLIANSGVLEGAGALTFAGGARLEGNTVLEGSGSVVFQGLTQIDLQLAVSGRHLLNQGLLSLHGVGDSNDLSLDLFGGATLTNAADATIAFEGFQVTSTIDGDGGRFTNAGTVKTIDNDVTAVISGLDFVNAGSVLDQFGSLEIDGSMRGHGTVEVDDGATFVFNGSSSTLADQVNIASGTGSVSLTGGTGDDFFSFAGNLAAADHVDGGSGNDTLYLNGDYSAGLNFGASTLQNVEAVTLAAGHSYALVFGDANLAAGQTMTVSGAALGAGNTLNISAATETDGSYAMTGGAGDDQLTGGAHGNTLVGGAGNDTLIGGAGADIFRGGVGADVMTGQGGADVFAYASAADSTGAAHDVITDFDAASDHIDLRIGIRAVDTAIQGGTLSAATFDTDLAAGVGSAQLGLRHAVLFTPSSGDLHGHTFLVIDANGTAGYQAGQDIVIDMTGGSLAGLGTANFI